MLTNGVPAGGPPKGKAVEIHHHLFDALWNTGTRQIDASILMKSSQTEEESEEEKKEEEESKELEETLEEEKKDGDEVNDVEDENAPARDVLIDEQEESKAAAATL